LFTSKTNESIGNFNAYIIEFFHDTLSFLLFETDDKPFPFKPNDVGEKAEEEGEIVEAELESVDEPVIEEEVKE
jgi:hypothetical protein